MRRMIVTLAALLAVALLVLVKTSAQSPRFYYPGECCGEYDCFNEPVAQDLVERRQDGWFLKKEGIVIPFDATRPSPDNQFRICGTEMGRGSIIIPRGRPACLWVPEAEH